MKLFSPISNSNKENLKDAFNIIFSGMIFMLAILTVARIIMLLQFALGSFMDISLKEQLGFFILSLRFDLKIITIAYLLPLLLTVCLFSFNFFRKVKKFIQFYSHLVVFVIFVFAVINYFYFKTYEKCIDTFIFAISKEDPLAVLKTVINDYPVFTGFFCILITCFVYRLLHRKLLNYLSAFSFIPSFKLSLTVFFAVTVLLFAGFIRGSLGTFPLRQLNAQICDKPAVNNNIPNGVIAFYWAYKWNQISAKLPKVTADDIALTYKKLGFKVDSTDLNDLFKPLKKTTLKNEFLEKNTPDIVFNVMESMSTHLLTYDDKDTRDLLGALRKNIKEDMFFTNFVSEGDGTSDSLTRLFVSVPDLNLSTSAHSDKNYICNIVKIFKKAGYETIFITASTSSWRNYDNFLRQLGFDKVVERSNVLKDFPNATAGAWGIDDEYLFKETYKVLKEKRDKPRFIMTLSITNHPPYRLPKDVEIQKIKLDDKILDRFPYDNTEIIFATFRYANDQLGKFIDAVKQDNDLKDNTFIAATGDHNLRGIGYSDYPEELVFGHEVPFYLYMPEKYMKNTAVKYDPQRLGSHKDIITTMISHAMSDFTFYSFGCDMLSGDSCSFPYAFNQSVAVGYGKGYACQLQTDNYGISYKITDRKNLLVSPKADDANCSKEAAFKKLEAQLYYFQAMMPEKLLPSK